MMSYNTKLVSSIQLLTLTSLIIIHQLESIAQITVGPGDHTKENFKQQEVTGNKYAVVVDCGSSGSRAHIFRWPDSTTKEELLIKVRPMLDPSSGKALKKSISPGLSSVPDTPELASDNMKPIMDFISSTVPQEAHRETPIYFLGTAGLRLLSKLEQSQILDDIAHDFKIQYDFPNIYTKVISGIQEGIYQWVSVNTYGNRLIPDRNQSPFAPNFFCHSPISRTFGMLEMGGASVQVSFEMFPELDHLISYSLRPFPDAYNAYKSSLVSFSLNSDKHVTLFSTTFLGLGANSARDVAIDLLVRDSIKLATYQIRQSNTRFVMNSYQHFVPLFYSPGSTLILEDPCLPVGAQETVAKPTELLYNQSKTIGFVAKAGQETFNVKLLGKGNYPLCQHLLNRLVWIAKQERLNCEEHKDVYSHNFCSTSLIGTQFIPFQYFQFIGLQEFYYTTKEMINADGPFNGPLVQRRAFELCSTPFEILLIKYPQANRIDKRRVLMECFKASWLLALLYTGLRLPVKFSDFKTLGNINGNDLDWTLGALIGKLSEQQFI